MVEIVTEASPSPSPVDPMGTEAGRRDYTILQTLKVGTTSFEELTITRLRHIAFCNNFPVQRVFSLYGFSPVKSAFLAELSSTKRDMLDELVMVLTVDEMKALEGRLARLKERPLPVSI